MRAPALALALAVAGAFPALAQHRAVPEYRPDPAKSLPKSDAEILAEARRAMGIQNLRSYGAAQAPKPKPFPFLALGIAFAVGLLATPFAYRMAKATRTELEDQATFGLKGGRRAEESPATAEAPKIAAPTARRLSTQASRETRVVSAEAAPTSAPVTARDAIWDAVSGAGAWVSVDWVASAVGLPTAEVADEIGALADEGYLKQMRDRSGTLVFRVNG